MSRQLATVTDARPFGGSHPLSIIQAQLLKSRRFNPTSVAFDAAAPIPEMPSNNRTVVDMSERRPTRIKMYNRRAKSNVEKKRICSREMLPLPFGPELSITGSRYRQNLTLRFSGR